MTERHKHADVLIAMAEGKAVECRWSATETWRRSDHLNPFDHHDWQWRIKPESVTVWVNVYPDWKTGDGYKTKKAADDSASPCRIACVQLTYTPGEGI